MNKRLVSFGVHDQNTIDQAMNVLENDACLGFALMSDGHLGYIMPVGGVAVYDNVVSVPGVGYDIACGNAAIRTDIKLSDIDSRISLDNPSSISNNKELNKLALQINQHISFGIGRSNTADDAPTDDPLFVADAWNIIPNVGKYRDDLRDKARKQLGTVGSGNHYTDVFVDRDDNHLWIGVHFGSRGLGHTIATNYLSLGQGGRWGEKAPEKEVLLDLSTDMGREYWDLMQLAGKYAYVGREWVARKILELLGGKELDLVHNNHNFAWKETHWIDGGLKEVVVVRKGATPAFPGERGFVGGSMGDDAVILRGNCSADDPNHKLNGFPIMDHEIFTNQYNGDFNWSMAQALYSTVHGAGRVMSRTEAAGKRDRKTGQLKLGADGTPLKAPKVTKDMMSQWLLDTGVVLRGGGVDESPHVYRRLEDVLRHQGDTIEVLHRLKPIIVCMASPETTDPYKD